MSKKKHSMEEAIEAARKRVAKWPRWLREACVFSGVTPSRERESTHSAYDLSRALGLRRGRGDR